MQPQNQDEPKSLLSNLRSHHIVNVFNPLSEDFRWPVARSVVHEDQRHVDPTMRQLNLRNTDHPSMAHVQQWITLPAGKSYKIPGDAAQVVVKHLVDEIMNREGHKQNLGDPVLRREVEERVIKNTDDLRSKLTTLTMEQQLEQQLREMNADEQIKEEAVDEEQPFPTAQGDGATEAAVGTPKPNKKG